MELLNEPSIDGYVPVSRTTTTVKDNYDVITIKNVTETRMREELRDGVVYGLSGAILYGIGEELTEILSNPGVPAPQY